LKIRPKIDNIIWT